MKSLPAKPVRNHSSREAAKHSSDSEDAHSYRVELVYGVLVYIFPVAIFVHVFHEVFDVLHVTV